MTFLYVLLFEVRLKKNKAVRWDEVTIIEEGSQDEVFFTESTSPSESVMSRSVHVEVARRPSDRTSANSGAVSNGIGIVGAGGDGRRRGLLRPGKAGGNGKRGRLGVNDGRRASVCSSSSVAPVCAENYYGSEGVIRPASII